MSDVFATSLLPPESQVLLKTVEDRLADYVKRMAPGVTISETDGSTQQKLLWNGVINFLLNQKPELFLQGWTVFLKVVHDNKQGAFSPAYVNRFRSTLQLGLAERRNFERLIHLAITTCDPKSRSLSLKQVDMGQILSMLPTETMRQKLIAYYQL